jgi:hypothetical protein
MTDSARLFPSLPTEAELDKRERDHEVDRTPRGLVRAALGRLLDAGVYDDERVVVVEAGDRAHIVWREGDGRPLRILDVCAGAGVWSCEARRLFALLGIPVEITAVEIREEERERLAKWADHVVIADYREVTARGMDGRFDLVIGNPHFTGLHGMLPGLLDISRAVILLHTTQAFQRGAEGQRLVLEHPPVLELRVGQSVKFRHGVNPANGKPWAADSLCYSVTAWVGQREPGSAWLTKGLALDTSARKWTEIPGAEERLGEDLPAAPGWKP